MLLYLLLLVFPDEVTLNEGTVLFRTRLRLVVFDLRDIREGKPHVTTRTMVMSGGVNDEAVVFYQIKLKEKPLHLLMFGKGMKNYRELYEQLIGGIVRG